MAQELLPPVKSIPRFQGAVAVEGAAPAAALTAGEIPAAANVSVDIRNWTIAGGTEVEELPLPVAGMTIVQLRAGEITTIIDGKRQERNEGEFWTVPAGVKMSLETEDDSAILQTIVVAEP